MNKFLSFSSDDKEHFISLPLSKSVRARELVLDALAGVEIDVETENDDIFVLSQALRDALNKDGCAVLDLHHSGTALRFMTAFCAVCAGEFLLTGSERLCERPIKSLVDALRQMGAEINYEGKEGFAPLRIKGCRLNGGCVTLDARVSSQFASALMLISDKIEGGLEIEYDGDIASKSYICLTDDVIKKYKKGLTCSGERDWSSATVWYAIMAVLQKGAFVFEGLSLDSLQPDRRVVYVFEKLGVKTIAIDAGIRIECSGNCVDRLEMDCENIPDAVMNIVVAACLLDVKFELRGVNTLRVKESDRIDVLLKEMRRCGYLLKYDEMGKICWLGDKCEVDEDLRMKTYKDHRVAMAMAVLQLVLDIEIEEKDVVEKSYPLFWNEYAKLMIERL